MKLDIDKLMRNKELKSDDKVILYLIHTDKTEEGYVKGNQYLATCLGIGLATLKRRLSILISKGYVNSITKKEQNRFKKIITKRWMFVNVQKLGSKKEDVKIISNIRIGSDDIDLPF